MQSVVAPATPKSSSTGPNAPAVPWPPTIGMEPVHRPIIGEMPNRSASPTARKFWHKISATTSPKKMISDLPPLFSTLRLA